MTKKELQIISEEITYIEERLNILSPNHIIESKQRKILLSRLKFLKYKIDCFLKFEKRKRLKVVYS